MRAVTMLGSITLAWLGGCGVSFQTGGEGGAPSSSATGNGGAGLVAEPGGMGGAAGTGGLSSGGGAGDGGGRDGLVCPTTLAGPPLVFVDAPGGAFCIDATEVTVGDYEAFETTAAPPQNGDLCAWNASYAPRIGEFDCVAQDYDTSAPDNAVCCIDWCDARDYCASVGKRLCGKIGGGPGGFADFADASVDEWIHACSAGGTKVFPYGDIYDPTRCIGDEFDNMDDGPDDHPQSVDDAPGCEGGVPGVFHMSGHVWEWTNACEADAADPSQARCRLRGGSFWDGDHLLFCAAEDFPTFVRDYANKNHGVRCCADPVVAE